MAAPTVRAVWPAQQRHSLRQESPRSQRHPRTSEIAREFIEESLICRQTARFRQPLQLLLDRLQPFDQRDFGANALVFVFDRFPNGRRKRRPFEFCQPSHRFVGPVVSDMEGHVSSIVYTSIPFRTDTDGRGVNPTARTTALPPAADLM